MARWSTLLAAALLGASADETARALSPCRALGARVLVYEASRLRAAGEAQLGLTRGRALPCEHAHAAAVVSSLERALASIPSAPLSGPLHVHVDPRLPPQEAPVKGVEVHATSREILVNAASLGSLPPEAWTHELLHALAPAPPLVVPIGRRLWLTLEEGLVGYLTLALAPHRPSAARAQYDLPGAWEELALPNYDPHPLAQDLTRELLRQAPLPQARGELDALLDCLTQSPAPLETKKVRDVSRAFVSRCAARPAQVLASAAGRWLPEAISPWPSPGARVVAAQPPETR